MSARTNTRPARKRSPNHPPAFRAAALAALDANGGNVRRTARELGLKPSTLSGWADGRRAAVDPELRAQKKTEFGAVLEDFARQLCGVQVCDVKGLNLRDLGVALGIVVDKLLLLRGQAITISKSESEQATIDVTRLTRDELIQLVRLHDKLNGVPPLPEASDLTNPVIVTDLDPDEAPVDYPGT